MTAYPAGHVGPMTPVIRRWSAASTCAGSARRAAIELCGSAEQVARRGAGAVDGDLRITVRSGGHCYEDFAVGNDGGVIVDMAPMNRVYRDGADGATASRAAATLWNATGRCTRNTASRSRRLLLLGRRRRPHHRRRLRPAVAPARPDRRLAHAVEIVHVDANGAARRRHRQPQTAATPTSAICCGRTRAAAAATSASSPASCSASCRRRRPRRTRQPRLELGAGSTADDVRRARRPLRPFFAAQQRARQPVRRAVRACCTSRRRPAGRSCSPRSTSATSRSAWTSSSLHGRRHRAAARRSPQRVAGRPPLLAAATTASVERLPWLYATQTPRRLGPRTSAASTSPPT